MSNRILSTWPAHGTYNLSYRRYPYVNSFEIMISLLKKYNLSVFLVLVILFLATVQTLVYFSDYYATNACDRKSDTSLSSSHNDFVIQGN